MTQPIDIKRKDSAKPKPPTAASSFAPGRPEEAPKPKVRPTILPSDSAAVAAIAKEVEKQEAAKEKLFWEQVERLEHEAEFDPSGGLFLFEEPEQKKPEEGNAGGREGT